MLYSKSLYSQTKGMECEITGQIKKCYVEYYSSFITEENDTMNCFLKITYPQVIIKEEETKTKVNDLLKKMFEVDTLLITSDCNGNTEYIIDYAIHYNNKGLFSITQNSYEYGEGAAHGHRNYTAINFDLQNGNLIRLQDILEGQYENKIQSEGLKILKQKNNIPDSETDFYERQLINPNFSIRDKGILIYLLGQSEVEGTYEIVIPYKSLAKHIKKGSLLEIFKY